MADSDFSSFNVAELKKRLKDAGLSTSGLKKDLVKRLEDHSTQGAHDAGEAEGSINAGEEEDVQMSEEQALKEEKSVNIPASGDAPAAYAGTDTRPIGNEDNAENDDNTIKHSASKHPPTSALYIGKLSRPLAVPSFKNHIEALAGEKPVLLHISAIRSHSFAIFSSREVASLVRDALNGKRYPEGDSSREPLFVDFLPADAAETWAADEAARENPSDRWVVDYVEADDGGIELTHRLIEAKVNDVRDHDGHHSGKKESGEPPRKRTRSKSPPRRREEPPLSHWPYIRRTRFHPPIMYSEAPPPLPR